VKLQALFFEIDGVLVDISRSYRRAVEETVAHFTGRPIEPGTLQRYKILGGFADDWRLTQAIVADAGIQVSAGRVSDEFQRRYRGENWDGVIVDEAPLVQIRTLERLHRMDRLMVVVSSRPEAEAHWILERFGWKRYFPLVIMRESHEGRGKLDPYPLLRALAILDAAGRPIEPAQAAFVSSLPDDMSTASKAGVWGIGISTAHGTVAEQEEDRLLQAGAVIVLHSLDALPGITENLAEHITRASPRPDAGG
jgi:HAD superfamily phosphatase